MIWEDRIVSLNRNFLKVALRQTVIVDLEATVHIFCQISKNDQ